jgi:hypothetical protein
MHDPLPMLPCPNAIGVDNTIPTITMESVVSRNKPMSALYIFSRASTMAKNLPPSIKPDQQTEIRVSPSLSDQAQIDKAALRFLKTSEGGGQSRSQTW